jgi:hypothetical protein
MAASESCYNKCNTKPFLKLMLVRTPALPHDFSHFLPLTAGIMQTSIQIDSRFPEYGDDHLYRDESPRRRMRRGQ